ncbi:hypothetical protein TD95_001459 [Thielaviopsis punctulata]|uniref:Signal recognition particle subunit SRP68 n=1 Tax=Thielaviopsis punctulata TaxID=72032 RepID=A0A0F4ZAK9_9PEZI|nr:hypothetical protein TD95_001459 [Thielaviopsis punctulata]
MDITKFVVSGREQALLYGDHSTYQAAVTRRLLSYRKKLGIVTKNRGKYHVKKEFTAEDIAQSSDYAILGILSSERAWAQAMGIKTQHATDSKGLTGKARTHIISRLHRAATLAEQVSAGLTARDSDSLTADVLEARAYANMIAAAEQFERRQWEKSLAHYAVARSIYAALLAKTTADAIFKDLIAETLDPNIRFAAYQLKVPRTLPIDVIVRKYFPTSANEAVAAEINAIDPSILKTADVDMADAAAADSASLAADEIPKTITWRSRQVPIEDGAIAQAWARVQASKSALPGLLSAALVAKDQAAAYDDILAATQDAVDATKQAIDELRGEGVPQSDARMQALQVTRTAVNYEMISWQIGRNRVLTGPDDGLLPEYSSLSRRQLKKLHAANQSGAISTAAAAASAHGEKPAFKLTKLKERVALYDGVLRSLDQIRDLPGVAADDALATRLAAYTDYFSALKALAIARSHALVDAVAPALALLDLGLARATSAASALATDETMDDDAPRNIDVQTAQAGALAKLLGSQVLRFRALVHISALRAEQQQQKNVVGGDEAVGGKTGVPLVETLGEYPPAGVDLQRLVEYPPRPTLIPAKPIFLDVAWNYIDYPGRAGAGQTTAAAAVAASGETAEDMGQKKRGWFGFGR